MSEDKKANLDRVNELIAKAIKEKGLHKLSNSEVEDLFLNSLAATSYVGEIPPLILAELTSRRNAITQWIAIGVSSLALVCSVPSIYFAMSPKKKTLHGKSSN